MFVCEYLSTMIWPVFYNDYAVIQDSSNSPYNAPLVAFQRIFRICLSHFLSLYAWFAEISVFADALSPGEP